MTAPELRHRILELDAQGRSRPAIAAELDVAIATVHRHLDPDLRARDRRHSRQWKARVAGTCKTRGAPTRYHGRGRTVSDRCSPCASAAAGVTRRGTGPTGRRVLELLDNGITERSTIARELGYNPSSILYRLIRYGLIERTGRGTYRKAAP